MSVHSYILVVIKMIWIKNYENIRTKLRYIITAILSSLAIFILLRYSKECSSGVLNGLIFCISVLIPSLFIFFVLSSYLSNSKALSILSYVLKKPCEKVFRLPSICSNAILLSIIGGYPIGAKSALSLYHMGSISKAQARKLSFIAVCSGPSFVINFIGVALLNNKKAGIIILISQFISYIITAVLCGVFINTDDDTNEVSHKTTKPNLVQAVESSVKASVSMCAMVIMFSGIIAVCDTVFQNNPVLCDIIAMTLEVTTALNRITLKYPLPVISFVTAFATLSIHFQIFSIAKELEINKFLFFFTRIFQGIIAGVATYILLILFPCPIEVFTSVESTSPSFSSTLVGTLALILTAVCFLNSLSNTKISRR